ncbi:MAG: PEP-CTERM sorting domain-containing protein [Akkermansiaceae bacterium]|tara:strand:+ start:6114 stop:6740 length:627 start_codon:yes stop_codon:yes gene_type:complete
MKTANATNKIVTSITIGLSAVSFSYGATLVTYDFSSLSSKTELPQLLGSASNLRLTSAFTISSDVANSTLDLIGTASNPNRIQFTYTVMGLGVGETLDIDSITIDLKGTGNGATNYVLNDTDSDTRLAVSINPSTFTNLSQPGTRSGLVNDDVFIVRFGLRDNQSGTNPYEIDNLTLNGTVNAVPEPSSAMLLGFGFAGLLIRRRRNS